MAKRCRVCGKKFPTDIALRRHVRESHRGYYYGIRIAPLAALIVVLLAAYYFISIPGGVAAITSAPQSTMAPTSSSYQSATTTTRTASPQGTRAPDFELPEVDELGLTGRTIKLSQFAGKPVFLEFMKPTCSHCLRMAPIIKELEEEYGDRIVFISIVYPEGEIEYASKVLAEKELDWIHVVDERLKVFNAYGVRGTPTYVILDENHVEVEKIEGAKPKDILENAILKVLS